MNYDAVCIKRATGAEVARNLPRRKVRRTMWPVRATARTVLALEAPQGKGGVLDIGRPVREIVVEPVEDPLPTPLEEPDYVPEEEPTYEPAAHGAR